MSDCQTCEDSGLIQDTFFGPCPNCKSIKRKAFFGALDNLLRQPQPGEPFYDPRLVLGIDCRPENAEKLRERVGRLRSERDELISSPDTAGYTKNEAAFAREMILHARQIAAGNTNLGLTSHAEAAALFLLAATAKR